MKNRSTEPSLHGNYGVMFYHNFFYEEAAHELALAVEGGQTEEGFPIKGMPLSNDMRVVEYYYTYGSALARTNQCGKALQIAQEIQANVRVDEKSMETINGAIGRINEICQENLENPPVSTPVLTDEEATEEPATELPEETATP
jgi:hypothetical protein